MTTFFELEPDFERQKSSLDKNRLTQWKGIKGVATEFAKRGNTSSSSEKKARRKYILTSEPRRSSVRPEQAPQSHTNLTFSGILTEQLAAITLKDSSEKMAEQEQQHAPTRPRFLLPVDSSPVKPITTSNPTTNASSTSRSSKRGAKGELNIKLGSPQTHKQDLKTSPITNYFPRLKDKSSSPNQSPIVRRKSLVKKRKYICLEDDSGPSETPKRAKLQKQKSVEIIGEYPVVSRNSRNSLKQPLVLDLLANTDAMSSSDCESGKGTDGKKSKRKRTSSTADTKLMLSLVSEDERSDIAIHKLRSSNKSQTTQTQTEADIQSKSQTAFIDISTSPSKSDIDTQKEKQRLSVEKARKKLTFEEELLFPEPGSEGTK